jgi:hypothetical protein
LSVKFLNVDTNCTCTYSFFWSWIIAISFFLGQFLWSWIAAIAFVLNQSSIVIWLSIVFYILPFVSAAKTEQPFPDIPFSAFSQIIESNFSSQISLATVLTILFTLTENVDLLNLHFRQQHPKYKGENKTQITAWMTALARALKDQLGNNKSSLYQNGEETNLSSTDGSKLVARKLNDLAIDLNLTPYDEEDNYIGKLLPVSHKTIQPVHVICPSSMVCGTATCKARSLVQATPERDIPLVTLIKSHKICKNSPVLTGRCPGCDTLYSADHERFLHKFGDSQQPKRVYLNSAKYLKLGTELWVDRLFARSVINAMYSFHASASAYAQYWNITFGTKSTVLTRAHMWQAFVQDSLRTIAAESKINIELNDPLNITEVTTQAFELLGEKGIIRASDQHACSECSQPYKQTSDAVSNDPTSVIGVDEIQNVPQLAGAAEVQAQPQPDNAMNIDNKNVTMVVLDGIVMGPTVIFLNIIIYIINTNLVFIVLCYG